MKHAFYALCAWAKPKGYSAVLSHKAWGKLVCCAAQEDKDEERYGLVCIFSARLGGFRKLSVNTCPFPDGAKGEHQDVPAFNNVNLYLLQ
jgi:hypothetical protein